MPRLLPDASGPAAASALGSLAPDVVAAHRARARAAEQDARVDALAARALAPLRAACLRAGARAFRSRLARGMPADFAPVVAPHAYGKRLGKKIRRDQASAAGHLTMRAEVCRREREDARSPPRTFPLSL